MILSLDSELTGFDAGTERRTSLAPGCDSDCKGKLVGFVGFGGLLASPDFEGSS